MENLYLYWEELVDKWEKEGYEKLTEDERMWFNIRSLIDIVDGGGIISFYSDYGAEYLEETMEDLYKLNAQNIIDIIEQVNKLFPNSKPSKDIDKRNEVILSWDDEDESIENFLEDLDSQFYELEDELESKLEPIVKKIISNRT